MVGPRPPLPKEASHYDPRQRRRLSMKPGLTCLWQVNGRNNVNFEKWMRMDLEYIDNRSLWPDTKILFKNIPAAVLARGAK
jgi:lipopolysaccharide/colanic/teichoic acid biosynthesis glycosyltransferase